MDVSIFLIVGVILLYITLWVHRHTYFTIYEFGKGYVANLEQPMKLQVWMIIVMAILAAIPIVNVLAFGIGATGWIMSYLYHEIKLGNMPKWWEKLTEFLTRKI